MMHGWYGGFSWIPMILGGLFWLALLAGLVVLIIAGIRRMNRGSGSPNNSPAGHITLSPKEILQARYARGEITREQYQQMLADLDH